MGFLENVNYYFYELADPRTKDWLVIRDIWSPIIIILIYVVFVFKLTPDYMKNRPAYKLNTFIKCYNLFQVITNAYLVREFSICYPFLRTFECRPIVYSVEPCAIRIINAVYILLLLKILDLIETILFLLRKKNSQVTFLHLYHHITTVLFMMAIARYFSVEQVALLGILNCAVHVVMYLYYFLSNFEGPVKQIIVPFKSYLTILQMVQFVIIIMQLISFLPKSCSIPKIPILLVLFNIILNFTLFYHFYRKSYRSTSIKVKRK